MDTSKYKVSVGTKNLRISRLEWAIKAFELGLPKETIKELSDEELQRWVILKELKDY